jgi:GNAT superfamily N-acetyltransferase
MSIIIKADIQDSAIVSDLIGNLLSDFNTKSGSDFIIDTKKLKLIVEKLIIRTNYAAFIAYDLDQKPIGLITIAESFAVYNGGDFGVITELYVDKNSRSKGLGKLLLNSAYEFSKTMSWKKIEVGTPNSEEWPRTLKFYKKNGFKTKGTKLRIEI